MACVLDFHAFQDNDNGFILKEVVLVNVENCMYTQFFFLPPFSFEQLNRSKQKSANWLTRHFHGLEWSSGELEYDLKILRKALSSYKVIYTRGLQKVDFINSFLVEDKNIKVIDCSLDFKKDKQMKVVCTLHKNDLMNCAMRNAISLCEYILLGNGILDYTRESDRLKSMDRINVKSLLAKHGYYYSKGEIKCLCCEQSTYIEHRKGTRSNVTYCANVPLSLETKIPRTD
jgi:hypothetical protein